MVDLGGGPRNEKLEYPVTYVFHGYSGAGRTTQVVSTKFPDKLKEAAFTPIEKFTGRDVLAAETGAVPFPQLLDPVDDLPPATLVTGILKHPSGWRVRGVSHDNGTVAAVTLDGHKAAFTAQHTGVADWETILPEPPHEAWATDAAGNTESWRQALPVGQHAGVTE